VSYLVLALGARASQYQVRPINVMRAWLGLGLA